MTTYAAFKRLTLNLKTEREDGSVGRYTGLDHTPGSSRQELYETTA